MENNAPVQVLPAPEVLEDGGMFLYRDPKIYEGQIANPVTRIEYPEEGGMLVYHQGDKYPSKGLPFRDAVLAIDVAKRSAMNAVRFLLSRPVRYFLPLFFILPSAFKKRILYSAIAQYSELAHTMFIRTSAYIKPHYMCTVAREVHRVGMEMAGEDEAMQNFVRTVCMVLEYDDAYRYRIQDIFDIIDRDAIVRNPGREISRVLLEASRRGGGTQEKFEMFARFLPLLFTVRSVRRPLVEFFTKLDFSKMVLDEADWYKCLIWTGYHFGGIPDRDRVSLRMMVDAEWQHHEGKELKPMFA